MSKSATVCHRIIAAMQHGATLGVPSPVASAAPLDTDMIVLGIVLGILAVGAYMALRMHNRPEND